MNDSRELNSVHFKDESGVNNENNVFFMERAKALINKIRKKLVLRKIGKVAKKAVAATFLTAVPLGVSVAVEQEAQNLVNTQSVLKGFKDLENLSIEILDECFNIISKKNGLEFTSKNHGNRISQVKRLIMSLERSSADTILFLEFTFATPYISGFATL